MLQPQADENRILLIENDAPLRESLRDLLEGEGFSVSEADNGQAALDYLDEHAPPGAILLDLLMPVMDGLSFLNRKQESGALSSIPTVIVSAVTEGLSEAHAYKDVVAVVPKPINVDRLVGLLKDLRRGGRLDAGVEIPDPTQTAGLLQSFISTLDDSAIFMLDPQGHITSWNAGAQRIKGYKADEIIGQHFSKFYPTADVKSGKPLHCLETAANQGKFAEENWRIRKDGSRFWASVIITAIRDAGGKLLGFGKFTRDVTEQRLAEDALRRSEERYRSLVAEVKEYAVFMLNPDGIIASWNAGAEQLKGYTAQEAIGKHFSIFYPPEDVEANKPDQELKIAIAEGKYEEEGWRLGKNGKRFLARVLLTPIRDHEGELLGFTKITRDITHEKEAEQIAEALRMRDLFLSIMSHELRTPVTSLLLQIDSLNLLMERSNDPDKQLKRLKKYLRISESQVTRLNKLVNDLLDFSRVSSKTVRIEKTRVDLNELIRGVADALQLSLEQSGNTLKLDLAPGLTGLWDHVRIEQAITNLVTNAIRHAPGTPISIASSRAGDEAIIQISDEGPGISEAELEKVTEPFVQSTLGHTPHGGLGIGLFITQSIVSKHGGSLSLKNKDPHGLTATINLPLSDSQTIE